MSSIGDRIIAKRTQKGLSQNKLAKSAGISQSALSSIESCTKSPSTDTISRLAAALGCSAAELLGEDVETRQPTDNEIKFALFGGDAEEISDEQLEEVKRYAHYLKERKKNGDARFTE